MSVTRASSPRSLGAALEHDRLERRLRRATLALAALRASAGASVYGRGGELGGPSQHLRHAIFDLEASINAMNTRLRHLAASQPRTASSDERSVTGRVTVDGCVLDE